MRFTRLLLIDDDQEDCEFFSLAVQSLQLPIQCTALNYAGEALNTLDEGRLLPDVIVIDLNMPTMTGEQFLAEKKRRLHLSSITVYVLTTSSEPAVLQRAIDLGATAAFSKPYNLSDLKKLITSIIN